MSNLALTWAWEQTGLTSSEKFVLIALADRADERHSCFPSYERIAVDVASSRRTVARAISSLEAKGFIVIEARRGKDGKHTSNRYVLTIGDRVPKWHPAPDEPSANLSTTECHHGTLTQRLTQRRTQRGRGTANARTSPRPQNQKPLPPNQTQTQRLLASSQRQPPQRSPNPSQADANSTPTSRTHQHAGDANEHASNTKHKPKQPSTRHEPSAPNKHANAAKQTSQPSPPASSAMTPASDKAPAGSAANTAAHTTPT